MKHPENFKPSREEQERAMKEVAKYLSPDKVLKSEEHPDLEVRGMKENTIEEAANQIFLNNFDCWAPLSSGIEGEEVPAMSASKFIEIWQEQLKQEPTPQLPTDEQAKELLDKLFPKENCGRYNPNGFSGVCMNCGNHNCGRIEVVEPTPKEAEEAVKIKGLEHDCAIVEYSDGRILKMPFCFIKQLATQQEVAQYIREQHKDKVQSIIDKLDLRRNTHALISVDYLKANFEELKEEIDKALKE